MPRPSRTNVPLTSRKPRGRGGRRITDNSDSASLAVRGIRLRQEARPMAKRADIKVGVATHNASSGRGARKHSRALLQGLRGNTIIEGTIGVDVHGHMSDVPRGSAVLKPRRPSKR